MPSPPRRKRSLGQWLGVSAESWPKKDGEELRPPKTVWDFLQLLIVPAVLILLGFAFSAYQAARDDEREDERAKQAATLARAIRMDEILQDYLAQMGGLILDEEPGRDGNESGGVRDVAQTLTLTVLRRLNGSRKGEVVRFLADANLVNDPEPTIVLRDADLRGAELRGASLPDVVFDAADLRGARFDDSVLDLTRFEGARLSRTSFSGASLAGVDFTLADLRHASFARAQMTVRQRERDGGAQRVEFGGACLSAVGFERGDTKGASFEGAEGVGVSFDGAQFNPVDLARARLVDVKLERSRVPDGWTATGARLSARERESLCRFVVGQP
jgi:uncharacterized protein YjbI with pentapeptide repeats